MSNTGGDDRRDGSNGAPGARRPPSIQPKGGVPRASSRSGAGQSSSQPKPVRRSTRPAPQQPAAPVDPPTKVMKPTPASSSSRVAPPSIQPGSRKPATPGTAEQRARAAEAYRGSEPGSTPPGTLQSPARTSSKRRKKRRPVRTILTAALLVLVIGLGVTWVWVESRLNHVDALSGAADTPGETYLIVGSDSRDGWKDDGTEGARTDTIMVLHKPEDGPVALISIPRDSYVEIPGNGSGKINAAYAWGGAPLLVETVEQLTGLTIDHYIEVGFSGVVGIVNAIGGVELCLDYDVDDVKSHLEWKAGCHKVHGKKALAFARMRYSDPLGDIGRTQRQQQVIAAVADGILSPATFLNPFRAYKIADAGLDAFAVDEDTHTLDLVQAALVFNSARGSGAVTGTPPIASMNYRVGGQSTVLLDPDTIDSFWDKIANGEFEAGSEVGGVE
ncbi:LCP family protein [Demequina salsinemoris]|uniref:LCP family protein n=1 Tax=Demequina salsinemoris TaxID=577470 RepID=UPI001F24C6E2|nr:LCP family protein [Demequina salsinemoris]